jgi:hypothetical protein
MGAIVRDNATGNPLMLSNFHVMCVDTGWHAGDQMAQPARNDGGACPGSAVGGIVRATLGGTVDCAVADITASRGNACEIIDVGAINGTGTASIGLAVRKRGRTTALTYGTVDSIDLTVSIDYGDGLGTQTLHGQIGIKPDPAHSAKFSDHGDSGAVVVNASNQVIGLNFAGDPTGHAIANPIADVLTALNISMCTSKPIIKEHKELKSEIKEIKEKPEKLEKPEHKELKEKPEKPEHKEHKEKAEKLEKPEIKEHKEHKEHKPEIKEHKPEIKEHKPEIKEHKEHKEHKPEIKEHKELKPEIKEHKELKPEIKEHKEKPEKHEIKDIKENKPEKHERKEFKELKPEKFEHGEKDLASELPPGKLSEGDPPFHPGGPLGPGGGTVGFGMQPGASASETPQAHFISRELRPDLSRGALSGESDCEEC